MKPFRAAKEILVPMCLATISIGFEIQYKVTLAEVLSAAGLAVHNDDLEMNLSHFADRAEDAIAELTPQLPQNPSSDCAQSTGDEDEEQVSSGKTDKQQAGIGIALTDQDGKIFVKAVLPNSPAARSKVIEAGDELLAFFDDDGKLKRTQGMRVVDIVSALRGESGTTVRLLMRPAEKAPSKSIFVSLLRADLDALAIFHEGGLLPIGVAAPDFEFVRLKEQKSNSSLTELGSRILIIEFWATWCGPCIEAVDELERLLEQHPQWKGRVEVLAVSVDEKMDSAIALHEKKQWSHVSVVWAGTKVLKTYRTHALPLTCVLGSDGTIVAIDHRLDFAKEINSLLESEKVLPVE